MITPADMHDLGRQRGVWIPIADVESYALFGWEIVEVVPHGEHVLMREPAEAGWEGRAA